MNNSSLATFFENTVNRKITVLHPSKLPVDDPLVPGKHWDESVRPWKNCNFPQRVIFCIAQKRATTSIIRNRIIQGIQDLNLDSDSLELYQDPHSGSLELYVHDDSWMVIARLMEREWLVSMILATEYRQSC